jgi:hypothetical protein
VVAGSKLVADVVDDHPRGWRIRKRAIGATSENAVIISSDSDVEIGEFVHNNYQYRRLITTIIQLGVIVIIVLLLKAYHVLYGLRFHIILC